jgi:hypothetical protein
MPDMRHYGRVGDRITVQLNPGKAAQSLTVVKRVFQPFIGQPVPLLYEIDPRHALQRDRRPTVFAFRIKWGKPLHEPGPRHNPFHFGQKPRPSPGQALSRRVRFFFPAYSASAKLP